MAGPASSSNNPGPATVTGNDYAGGASPYYVGVQASSLVGFYGTTPVVQRATGATHSTSGAATSSSFGATQSAIMVEIMNTLIGLGIWAP